MQLTQEKLRELLHYDPTTGVFRWRIDAGRWGRIPAGSVAGSIHKVHGYCLIKLGCRLYPAHRLAWLYMTGQWPAAEIDHINQRRADNRFANLRECTPAENMKNKTRYRSNTSGRPGVSWHRRIGAWQARIGHDGKRRHMGYWEDMDCANAIYRLAKFAFHHKDIPCNT